MSDNNLNNDETIINSNEINPKKGKFTLFVIIGVVIVICAIVIFLFIRGKSQSKVSENLDKIFDPNKPIIVAKGDKYGYITHNGKMMIEPKYDVAGDFSGKYAKVATKIDGKKTMNYQIIDKKGNVKMSFESYSGPKYHSDYDVWEIEDKLYDGNLKLITKKNVNVDYISNGMFEYKDNDKDESGIMNYKGKVIFSWSGTSISAEIPDVEETEEELYASVTNYEDRGVIISLKTGKILYTIDDVKNNYIYEEEDSIFRILNKENEKEKFLYFSDDKLAYEVSDIDDLTIFDSINKILEIDYGYNYETLNKKNRYAYYDVKNKKLLDSKPSTLDSSEDNLLESLYGYKKYSCSSKEGIMSGDKVIISCEYDDVDFININLYQYMKNTKKQELVLLEKDDKTTLINLKNQKELSTFDSVYINDYDSSTFIKVSLRDNKGVIIYNLLTGKSMTFDKNDKIDINSNYIVVTKNNKDVYYNTEFKEVYKSE